MFNSMLGDVVSEVGGSLEEVGTSVEELSLAWPSDQSPQADSAAAVSYDGILDAISVDPAGGLFNHEDAFAALLQKELEHEQRRLVFPLTRVPSPVSGLRRPASADETPVSQTFSPTSFAAQTGSFDVQATSPTFHANTLQLPAPFTLSTLDMLTRDVLGPVDSPMSPRTPSFLEAEIADSATLWSELQSDRNATTKEPKVKKELS